MSGGTRADDLASAPVRPPGPFAYCAFDIGGVLLADTWETVILSPRTGIAERNGVSPEWIAPICRDLWRRFCVGPATEDEYWSEFERRVGFRPSSEEISAAEAQIWINDEMDRAFAICRAAGVEMGLVSDNTQFWFAKQRRWAPPLTGIGSGNLTLSFLSGRRKSGPGPSLFQDLAARCDPNRTLVVDDSEENISRARDRGFAAVRYVGRAQGSGLAGLVDALLGPPG